MNLDLISLLRTKIFFNYPDKAIFLSLFNILIGMSCVVFAVVGMFDYSNTVLENVLMFAVVTAVLAYFPVQIPSTKLSLATSDLLIFIAMVKFGPAAVVVVSCIEGLTGSLRTSKRLSSHLNTVSTNAFAAISASVVFFLIQSLQIGNNQVRLLVGLLLASIVYSLLQSFILASILQLSSSSRIAIENWLTMAGAGIAIQIVSGLIAAIVIILSDTISLEMVVMSSVFIIIATYFFRLHLKNKERIEKELDDKVKISDLKAQQHLDRINYLAYHDELTNTFNRRYLNHDINGSIFRSEKFAILFFDLDRFKNMNDSLGHAAGDKILKEISSRLKAAAGEDGIVARLGGDEFVVKTDEAVAIAVAERIKREVSETFVISNTMIIPVLSCGLAFSHNHKDTDSIVQSADLAMYESKKEGRGNIKIFDEKMSVHNFRRLQLESDLRRAIDAKQLTVMYQPLIDLNNKSLNGFEALVRWNHDDLGAISPAIFIPLAEESTLVSKLTICVIEIVLAQMSKWGALAPRIHINISARDLSDPRFFRFVDNALKQYNVNPELIVIELTESVVVENKNLAIATFENLKDLGVKITIDDFGTGYSSLSQLSILPVDGLKIDQSFVTALLKKPEAVEIVRAIVALGTALGKEIVAEGIEDIEQFNTLLSSGVHLGQGYLISPPVSAEHAFEFVQTGIPSMTKLNTTHNSPLL